jgi:hypothetical protein
MGYVVRRDLKVVKKTRRDPLRRNAGEKIVGQVEAKNSCELKREGKTQRKR